MKTCMNTKEVGEAIAKRIENSGEVEFFCEGCGRFYRFIAYEFKRWSCDCGATYMPWFGRSRMQMKCIVRPVE